MNVELQDALKALGCKESPKLSERDEELFLRHHALCRECSGLDSCRERGYVLQISLSPDKSRARLTMGPCKLRQVRDVLRRSEKLFSEPAIPPALRECGFENYVTEGRSESVRRAKFVAMRVAGTDSSLVLAGSVGTGKTHLAAAIVRSALAQGRTALFISAIGYLERLKSTFDGKQSGLYIERVDHVKSVECLAIDDLGAERPSTWAIERLYDAINARIERGIQTVVTTNFLDPAALERRLEADPEGARRIVSRLLYFGWLTMKGDDYRLQLRNSVHNSDGSRQIKGL
jgi:DNA replication protein DnaC